MPPAPRLPDWSALPLDIVAIVVSSLDITDALAASVVCTGWRAGAALHLGRASTPRRCLWILRVKTGDGDEKRATAAVLHDVFSARSYRFTFPGLPAGYKRAFLGTTHGWILLFDYAPSWYQARSRDRLSLVNPFTGACIPLPLGFHFGNDRRSWWFTGLYDCRKFVLTGDPFRSGGHYTIGLMTDYIFLLLRAGDDEWESFRGGMRDGICDCISHHGKLLTVDGQGAIKQWDVDSTPWRKHCPKSRIILQAPRCKGHPLFFYLVAAPWGELLQVQRQDFGEYTERLTEFIVYAVDPMKRARKRTTDLRDHAMILWNINCSLVSVKTHPALLANCIFFYYPRRPLRNGRSIWKVGVYNLTSQTLQPLPPSLAPPLLFELQDPWIISPSNVECNSTLTSPCCSMPEEEPLPSFDDNEPRKNHRKNDRKQHRQMGRRAREMQRLQMYRDGVVPALQDGSLTVEPSFGSRNRGELHPNSRKELMTERETR